MTFGRCWFVQVSPRLAEWNQSCMSKATGNVCKTFVLFKDPGTLLQHEKNRDVKVLEDLGDYSLCQLETNRHEVCFLPKMSFGFEAKLWDSSIASDMCDGLPCQLNCCRGNAVPKDWRLGNVGNCLFWTSGWAWSEIIQRLVIEWFQLEDPQMWRT